jgi:hypothetical protein
MMAIMFSSVSAGLTGSRYQDIALPDGCFFKKIIDNTWLASYLLYI